MVWTRSQERVFFVFEYGNLEDFCDKQLIKQIVELSKNGKNIDEIEILLNK